MERVFRLRSCPENDTICLLRAFVSFGSVTVSLCRVGRFLFSRSICIFTHYFLDNIFDMEHSFDLLLRDKKVAHNY